MVRGIKPFGLVMVEAVACGTPVIAYNLGALGLARV
jgi:glycosyltransferase involved in cell wall biosynthesis